MVRRGCEHPRVEAGGVGYGAADAGRWVSGKGLPGAEAEQISWLAKHLPLHSGEWRGDRAGRPFKGCCQDKGERRVGGSDRLPKVDLLEAWLPAPSWCWRAIVPLNLLVLPVAACEDQ